MESRALGHLEGAGAVEVLPMLLENIEGKEGNTRFPPFSYIPTFTRTCQTQT